MAAHAPARVTRMRRAERLRGIYAIVNEAPSVLEIAAAALRAGVAIVQYRAKNGIVAEHVVALRRLTLAHDALLVMNDDWRAADAFDCDGVHLGPGDAGFDTIARVRDALPQRLIGVSCGTAEQARGLRASQADYIGVGSVYRTESKADAGDPIGIDGLVRVASSTPLPVAAIGGITAERIAEVRRTGVAMAAVISALASSAQPEEAARDLIAGWNQ
ncbi:MAG: thiamine phosphate synthase [Candidatus Baltobacteraceae bacterium]